MTNGLPEVNRPNIIFGCGQLAKLISLKNGGEDESGVPIVELYMMPTIELIKYYGLVQDIDLDQYNCIRRRYASMYITFLSEDPSNGCVLVNCAFDHGRTKLTDKEPETETFKELYKQIHNLKISVAKAREENRLLLAQESEWMKDKMEYFGQVLEMTKRNKDKDDEDEK